MATGVQVKGLREVVRSLEKFGVEAADLKAAFKKVGNVVVNDAQQNAPTLTGRLSGSIKASNTKNKSIVRAGGARIPYAGVIHYGGYHGIEAHPFLTDAVQNKQAESVRIMEQELSSLIKALDLN